MLCMPATTVASERVFSKAGVISRAKEVRRNCHFSDRQSVTVASLLGRYDSDVRVITKYVGLCMLSLSDLDFSIAT